MGSDNIESLNGVVDGKIKETFNKLLEGPEVVPKVLSSASERSKETNERQRIDANDLYEAGKRIEEAISICKLLQSDPMFEAAYRYAKLVDYSEKKHDCSNAKALIKITELECKDDVKAAKLKRMFQITLASSNGL